MKLIDLGTHQRELAVGGKLILFSYQTPVAAYIDGKYYRTQEKYSVTTSSHINKWLGDNEAESKPQSFFDECAA